MNKNYKLFCTVTAGAASLLQCALADGYRNPPSTAEGIAKSGVNSVWVDDASAVSYNPANLAFQTNHSFVASVTMARTENTYTIPLTGTYESSGDWNVLPNLYYSTPAGENGIAFGLGISTPYGQGLSWGQDEMEQLAYGITGVASQTNIVPYEAGVMMVNINPSIAFKLREDVSMGIGLDLYLSQFELKAVNAVYVPVLSDSITFNSEAEGFGAGVGANLGLSWDVAEGHRLTATYRSAFEIEYTGEYQAGDLDEVDFETSIQYPHIVTLGYGVQLTGRVQLEAMVEWLNWSSNEKQTLDIEGFPSTTLDNSWEDTFTFGLGGAWQALDSLAVRAGYAFIPSPVPDETLNHLLPDADRHALSFGLGYTYGAHTLDVAYTLSIYEERSSQASGIYEIDSDLVGLTYSTSF